jgi:hypothetical protein
MNDPSIISDCFGRPWRVAETLPTVHGWTLYRGRPVREDGSCVRQGATVIPTPELRDHLAATVETPYEVDLPISRPVVSRLRHALGLAWRAQRRQWWEERAADLEELTEDKFAARHGVAQSAVSVELKKRDRRRRSQRRLDDPGFAELLQLEISHAELARILRVSNPTAARWRAKLASATPALRP